jgi:hypothetical protein
MPRALAYLAMLSVVLIPLWPVTAASEPYAAVLTVIHPGVTIQRANTSAWLPLSTGSVAPFGAGDRLRTDDTGRAFVSFGPESRMLVLPGSVYQLERLDLNGQIQLTGNLSGIAVHSMGPVASYRLTLHNSVITQPATLFATWAEAQPPLGVTVAEGSLEVSACEQSWSLQPGQGLYVSDETREVITFDPPWNIARMQGLLEGCPGIVATVGNVPLRVRIGPGEGYIRMGGFDQAQAVLIMAVNESLGWYRIQFLSGFGWLLKAAVRTECENLPVLPDNTSEQPLFIRDASPDEIELLRPFFGSPVINGWFYQWTTPN